MLVVLAVATTAVVGPAAGGTAPDARLAAGDDAPVAQATATETADRHWNPATHRGQGDRGVVRDRLLADLLSALTGSAGAAADRRYESARDDLGPGFNRSVEKYAAVAASSSTRSERVAQAARDAGHTQRRLVGHLERFTAAHEDYRAARERGDDAAARRYGHAVERHGANASAAIQALTADYRRIERRSGVLTADARRHLGQIRDYVSTTRERVSEETFATTRLTAERVGSGPSSAADPLALRVTIQQLNGAPVADERVRIDVANRTHVVRTDGQGRATVRYRPVAIPTDAEQVRVAFRPSPDDPYVGATTTAPIDVRQVSPNVSVTVAREQAAYGDTVGIEGDVGVAGTGLDGVPVVAELGDRTIAAGRTQNGSVALDGRIPAGVADGERRLTLRVPLEGRALAGAAGTTGLTVTRTGTDLTLGVEPPAETASTQANASGVLTTTSGRTLANRTVHLQIEDGARTTVRTGPDGRYEGAVPVPEDAAEASVTATFPGDGNLAARTVTVALSPGGGAVGPGDDGASGLIGEHAGPVASFATAEVPLLGVPWWVVGAAFFGAFVAVAGVQWLRRSVLGEPSAAEVGFDDDPGDYPTAAEALGVDEGDQSVAATDPDRDRLAEARDRLEGGDGDAAVVLAYRAVRDRLADVGVPRGATHWEFLNACWDAEEYDASDALERLTRLYERAQYSPSGVSPDEASGVVGEVEGVVDGE